MFSPLSGEEESNRLRDKFALMDDSPSFESCSTNNRHDNKRTKHGKGSNRGRGSKTPVVKGGASRTSKSVKTTDTSILSDDESISIPKSASENKSSTCSTFSSANSQASSEDGEMSGFSNEDLEKPHFSVIPSFDKKPYQLSGDGETPTVEINGCINRHLREYQREGVQFLYNHYKKGTGAILGDDMGLGKTVQVIAFISAILGKTGTRQDVIKQRPDFIKRLSREDGGSSDSDDDMIQETKKFLFLIIVPGSVVYNWMSELDVWGHFLVRKYHGQDKDQSLADVERGKVEILITTFDTYRENADVLNKFHWTAVFVDEVHKIKGIKSQIRKALNTLPCKCRYGLTGTALQNNMLELWCLLDWANPGCLGTAKQFQEKYVYTINRSQKVNATKRELADGRYCTQEFGEFRKEYLLRRTKSLIAEQLPNKEELVVYCKLTDLQVNFYKTILESEEGHLIATQNDPCDCGSGGIKKLCCHVDFNFKSMTFRYMHLLLKVANHPALLHPRLATSADVAEFEKEISKELFGKYPQYLDQEKHCMFLTLSSAKHCGKMKVLQGMLSVFKKERCKVLVFSYSTKLLDILEQYVNSMGYDYRRIDGKVSNKQRFMYVQEFNNDRSIFMCLMSTKAGGIGLNLTGANVVVIYDPNWNPSHDIQAQDRAYRIGQRRDVRVYRLVSSGTIEENIYLRQVYKQQLDSVAVDASNARRYFQGIAGDKYNHGELFGIKNMFQLRTGDRCLTDDILKRNDKIESGLKDYKCFPYISPPVASNDEETGDPNGEGDAVSEEESEYPTGSQPSTSTAKPSTSTVAHSSKRKTSKRKTCTEDTESSENDNGFTTIQDVLDNFNISHKHSNKQIVGSSRAEDHMSKCAIQDVYENNQLSQELAIHCEPYSEEEEERRNEAHNDPRVEIIDNLQVLIGQTPRAVKTKHFTEMADVLAHSDPLALAKRVLSSTTKERLNILEQFYLKKDGRLGKVVATSSKR